MPSAGFTVNGQAVTELAVEPSTLVTLALTDTSYVDVVDWTVIGSHSSSATNPVITPSGSPYGSTATFTMPAGYSQCFVVQSEVNGGRDSNGAYQASYVSSAVIGVASISGVMPFAANETYERDPTHGWTDVINRAITGNSSNVAASGKLTTTDAATVNTIATIATSSEYQYFVSAIVSSRQSASSNTAFTHLRFLMTNKGGTLAQQGTDDLDALNYDAITMTGIVSTTSGTNILVTFQGKAATTIRHEYLVEYIAMRIPTS